MPFFSVIIPTYNRADKIPRAISSVLNQIFPDFELIIIDDGSTDGTRTVIQEFSDSRLKYYYQENKERSAARNLGIAKAIGQYICFLDSDDEFLPNYLNELHAFLKSNDFPLALIKSIPAIKRQDGIVDYQSDFPNKEHANPDWFIKTYSPVCSICVSSEILKQERFDTTLRYAEDTNLWVRILLKHQLLFAPVKSCLIHVAPEEKVDLKLHYEYIQSFSKTFKIPGVKQLFDNTQLDFLFLKRLNWIKAISKSQRKFSSYLRATFIELLFKIGFIRFY